MINIAVLGYGTVGSGVVEVIRTNHETIGKRAGEEIRIKYVLDLREFPGDPVEEIRSAKLIIRTLGLRKGGIEVVSCPTCGRTQIDLIGLANEVENMVADIPLDLKVAVMGCVVNGPGEAREADIGIAGGKGEGLLIKKGETVKKVKEEELLGTLREELLIWKKTD